ncbi:MAG TPA: hypothetical protein VG963_15190 [Polyangiaceae bacterium]|nr:hypothetical protein [Polyangiaceae bacterium]
MRVRLPRLEYGLLALSVCALTGQGGSEAEARFNGAWVNAASDQGRAEIEQAVDRSIHDMFALAKPTARSRLLAANPAIDKLEIAIADQTVRVNLGHGRDTRAAQGAWQNAKSATGDPVRIRYTLTPAGVLKMESLSDGGSGRHTFRVLDDGKMLRHEVRIESSHLPEPVRYQLDYRRAP